MYVGTLDSSERKLLVKDGVNPKYADGYFIYQRDRALVVQRFDLRRLQLAGDAVPLANDVQVGGQGGFPIGAVSVSETGAIAYQAGAEVAPSRLAWFDRAGKQIGLVGDPGDYAGVALAPDGARAAISVVDSARRTRDIGIYDVARGLRRRFTFDPAGEESPIWSPDGGRVVFVSDRKGPGDLYEKPSTGGTDEELLFADSVYKTPLSWSPNGQRILYATIGKETGSDLWVLPLTGDKKPLPFRQTRFNETSGRFSPDGPWITYVSDESGRQEVYVASFGGLAGGSFQISTAGYRATVGP